MTYNVQVGSGGFSGWKILERSMSRQKEVFAKTLSEKSAQEYFMRNISKVNSADELVRDYKLLTVSLRAFGLDADVNNRFFIKKVLESDPADEASLVNRLADKRYLQMNQALKLGMESPTGEIDVSDLAEKYVDRSFEKNIGERYPEIELALNAQRELPSLADSTVSDNAKWYHILGSKALRKVFEVAYGLGSSFSALPIDRQLSEIKAKAEKITGSNSASQFKSSDETEKLIRIYLLRNQVNSSSSQSSHANALTLLRG